MIDLVTIKIKGGRGGDGAIAFAVQKYKPKAPPSGGSGGKGGSVYLIVDTNVATLKDFISKRTFTAENGYRGGSNDKTGKCADDLYIRVPVGTSVSTSKNQLATHASQLQKLDNPGQTLLVALGGAGGRGNAHMPSDKTGTDYTRDVRRNGDDDAPIDESRLIQFGGRKFSERKHIYYAEKGQKGEEKEITLELKLIADVGLIGLPNAGKSSLLNALTRTTNARVGSYPFTTLEPNLGVISDVAAASNAANHIELDNTDKNQNINWRHKMAQLQENQNTKDQEWIPASAGMTKRAIVLADIPGLIEGASAGKGLGANFLKHIEKTKVLVHILSCEYPDVAAALCAANHIELDNSKNQENWRHKMAQLQNYKTIREELGKWNPSLLDKPEIVVVNKIDLIKANSVAAASNAANHIELDNTDKNQNINWRDRIAQLQNGKNKIFFVSALTGEGVGELKKAIIETVQNVAAASNAANHIELDNTDKNQNINWRDGIAQLHNTNSKTTDKSNTFSLKTLPNRKMVFTAPSVDPKTSPDTAQ